MESFWKLFGTLFGIGAAVSFAKSLKSRRPWREVVSEMIITGFLATIAGLIYLYNPETNIAAITGAAAFLAVLGTAFLGEKIEKAMDAGIEKFLGKKDGA